jgi:signal peptidase II
MNTDGTAAETSAIAQPVRRKSWSLWLLFALLIAAADQFTKLLVADHLVLFQRITILPFLDFVRLHNKGAAFSFLAGASGWQNWLFTGVGIVVSVGVFWWLTRLPRHGRTLLALGLSLLLGGAIGNLIDRVVLGYVLDFILFYYQGWSFPAFNLADSAISCGVVLILLDGLLLEPGRPGVPVARGGEPGAGAG